MQHFYALGSLLQFLIHLEYIWKSKHFKITVVIALLPPMPGARKKGCPGFPDSLF